MSRSRSLPVLVFALACVTACSTGAPAPSLALPTPAVTPAPSPSASAEPTATPTVTEAPTSEPTEAPTTVEPSAEASAPADGLVGTLPSTAGGMQLTVTGPLTATDLIATGQMPEATQAIIADLGVDPADVVVAHAANPLPVPFISIQAVRMPGIEPDALMAPFVASQIADFDRQGATVSTEAVSEDGQESVRMTITTAGEETYFADLLAVDDVMYVAFTDDAAISAEIVAALPRSTHTPGTTFESTGSPEPSGAAGTPAERLAAALPAELAPECEPFDPGFADAVATTRCYPEGLTAADFSVFVDTAAMDAAYDAIVADLPADRGNTCFDDTISEFEDEETGMRAVCYSDTGDGAPTVVWTVPSHSVLVMAFDAIANDGPAVLDFYSGYEPGG